MFVSLTVEACCEMLFKKSAGGVFGVFSVLATNMTDDSLENTEAD